MLRNRLICGFSHTPQLWRFHKENWVLLPVLSTCCSLDPSQLCCCYSVCSIVSKLLWWLV